MAIIINTPIGGHTKGITSDPYRSAFDGYGSYGDSSPRVPEVVPDLVLASNEQFLLSVLKAPKRIHHISRGKLVQVTNTLYGEDEHNDNFGVPTCSLGIQAVHQCFASHVPFTLSPQVAWYMVLYSVAEHVRQNSAKYARLFTDTPEAKQEIRVRNDTLVYGYPDGWDKTTAMFYNPLRAKISDETADMFLPPFSTLTPEDALTLLVSLMDAASPYYEYVAETRCGIPQIKLDGTAEDWRTLYGRASQMASKFDGLTGYFKDLLPVLQTIAETAAGSQPDIEFWQAIYKKVDPGSGSPSVDGWLTAFFAYSQTERGMRLRDQFDWRGNFGASKWGGTMVTDEFPSHVTQVPFLWEYHGTTIPMAFAGGILGVDEVGGFIEPKLGFGIVETANNLTLPGPSERPALRG